MKLPRGFLASGVRAGIRKKRPDLGVIVAPDGASAAAVFTKNRFQAAPVILSKAALKKSGGRVTAVVVNAGCANAVTGKEGMDAARRSRARAAELLRCGADEVFVASTGVIGVVLPDKKLRDALPDAITRVAPSPSRTIIQASSRQTSSSARWKSSRSLPLGPLPLARSSTVSFVDVSPSTEIALKL